MGKKDNASWEYFQDEARVADIINVCCYGGKRVVKPEDVSDADSRNENSERDLIKKTALGTRYAFIGFENQDNVDYSLPVRIMGYDYRDYKKQTDKVRRKNRRKRGSVDDRTGEFLYEYRKTDQIYPVVTIVLYYGDRWDGPKSIGEMLDADIGLKSSGYLQDYRINLIEVNNMSDEELDRFQTDVKQVFKFIRNRKDKEKMSGIIENDPYYSNVEKTAHDMMAVYGGLRGYKINEADYRSEGGGIDMCKAWDDWREDGRKEGIREERINTERERKNAEKERQNAEKERQNAEKERRKTERALKRAEKAEAEIIRLKALLAEARAQA